MPDGATDIDPKRAWLKRVLGVTSSPPGGPSVSLASLAKASLSWRAVCASTLKEVGALKSQAAAKARGLYDDDEMPEVLGDLDRLDTIQHVISPEISGFVDDIINAAPTARPALLRKLVADITALETAIPASEIVLAAQDNGLRALDLTGPTLAALRVLRTEMSKLIQN
jgi:hypothetical protein